MESFQYSVPNWSSCVCSRRPQRRPRGVLLAVVLLPLLRRPQRRRAGQSVPLPPQSSAEPGENAALPADRLLRRLQEVRDGRRLQCRDTPNRWRLTGDFPRGSVGFRSVSSCVDDLDESRSLQLKRLLSEYFDKRRDRSHAFAPQEVEELARYQVGRLRSVGSSLFSLSFSTPMLFTVQLSDCEEQIRADIRNFLATRSDEKFSGRAVARILHGIGQCTHPFTLLFKACQCAAVSHRLVFNRV